MYGCLWMCIAPGWARCMFFTCQEKVLIDFFTFKQEFFFFHWLEDVFYSKIKRCGSEIQMCHSFFELIKHEKLVRLVCDEFYSKTSLGRVTPWRPLHAALDFQGVHRRGGDNIQEGQQVHPYFESGCLAARRLPGAVQVSPQRGRYTDTNLLSHQDVCHRNLRRRTIALEHTKNHCQTRVFRGAYKMHGELGENDYWSTPNNKQLGGTARPFMARPRGRMGTHRTGIWTSSFS